MSNARPRKRGANENRRVRKREEKRENREQERQGKAIRVIHLSAENLIVLAGKSLVDDANGKEDKR